MPESEERIARNEVLFREVNERIVEASGAADFPGPTVFVCECGRADCAEPIELTLEEYEALRGNGARFAVRPGHEVNGIERVVDRTDRFVIVEKAHTARQIADANDPRS